MTNPHALPNDAFSAVDYAHMALALRLAEAGRYTTRPNPRVGCVLAHGAEIVGTGWHQRAGEPHAEVHAIAAAGARAQGSTAYVTLEPCAHFGRTPPCADALIHAGVARVVAACVDPFVHVAGAGLARLQAAGIRCESGLMYSQARALNAGFFSRIERGRPWLRGKIATSVDGRTALANGTSQWLTGPEARADVHRWRAQSCAILTGVGTVLADDPSLDVRLALEDLPSTTIPPPLKIVLDRQLRTPPSAKLLRTSGAVLIAHLPDAAVAQQHALQDAGASLLRLPQPREQQLPALLAVLAQRQINEVHIEAGAVLAGALLQAELMDELLLYQAPIVLGDRAKPMFVLPELQQLPTRWQLELLEQHALGVDLRLRYSVRVQA
jgi:diaminohydroxyphosphoribosylaminopyrimidine deaminase / 5-amino-6-(5-phosphoribosylamino)uracil reductase